MGFGGYKHFCHLYQSGFTAATVLVLIFVRPSAGAESESQTDTAVSPSSPCLKFLHYTPSQWEHDWLTHATTRRERICDQLAEEHELAKHWAQNVHAETLGSHHLDETVWSNFVYQDNCASPPKLMHLPIEPAVGLLRHPLAQPCHVDNAPLSVEDRNYFRIASTEFISSFPGKKLLFDLGSGKAFSSSLKWLVDSYSTKQLHFDEIWAWEVAETSQQEYWEQVPDEIVDKLHFYNTYASDKEGLPAPIAILRSRYKAGDFVVIKLDIDNETLESSIMEQLLQDPEQVNEIFFEKHFDAPEMRPYFGHGLATTLEDTLAFFHKCRMAGMRLHYWP